MEPNGDEMDGSFGDDDFHHTSQVGGLHWAVPAGRCDDDEEDDHSGGADDAEPEHDLFPSYGDDQSRGTTGCGYEPKWRPR